MTSGGGRFKAGRRNENALHECKRPLESWWQLFYRGQRRSKGIPSFCHVKYLLTRGFLCFIWAPSKQLISLTPLIKTHAFIYTSHVFTHLSRAICIYCTQAKCAPYLHRLIYSCWWFDVRAPLLSRGDHSLLNGHQIKREPRIMQHKYNTRCVHEWLTK